MHPPHWLLVTGRLAEPALRRTLEGLAPHGGFAYTVATLPISVIALAPTDWIARHLALPSNVTHVLVPGLCPGELGPVEAATGLPVQRGPKDLRDLPEFFGAPAGRPPGYGEYDIEILAEINHAPRLDRESLRAAARAYQASGADVIDLGCDPGSTWTGVGDAVRALRAEGLRVSIDSFDAAEVEAAVHAGAELALSVNATNRKAARSWGCEVVALPDDLATLGGLDETVEALLSAGVPFRIDPVLEPVGLGFAASLGRYLEVRRRYPDAEILMGVGNLTELTDADSSGLNVLLLGFCQEIGVRSVLTTEVINWCRSCVRELDLARRLVYHACRERVVPKRLEPDLHLLRDPKLRVHGDVTLADLAARVSDRNVRLFAERGLLHVLNNQVHLRGTDPFELFARLCERQAVEPAHAFYLGYELAKAVTALTLGKNYNQDQALRWGFLTAEEKSAHRSAGEGSQTPGEK